MIQFKHEFSTEKVEFLDLVISLEDNRIKTNLFIKPCNKQLYLDYYSNHPEPCKEGVVYGQAIRVIERCSDNEDAEKHLKNLQDKLEKRNYPEKLIVSKFTQAKKRTRTSLINESRQRRNGQDKKVRLLFTYNEGNPPLHRWVREAKKCLVKDDRAKELGDNFQICYKQPRNLKSLVTHPRKPQTIVGNPGCKKCGRCRVSCPVMEEGGKFKSTNTGKSYPIRKQLNCDSSYVVYLVTCKRCRGQYVGKSTTPFKIRHSHHKQEMKRKYGGLGHHYGGDGCGYENVSLQIIDQVEFSSSTIIYIYTHFVREGFKQK